MEGREKYCAKIKWKKMKIKKINELPQVHHDYFLVKSVHMDVLIKKHNCLSETISNEVNKCGE